MTRPKPAKTRENSDGRVETIITKASASDELERIINRNVDLEEIFVVLQPLLHTVSVAMYGEHNPEPVALDQLVRDACAFINNYKGETIQ